MDYLIFNPSKRLFIRLDRYGAPETCSETCARRFEYSKAKNIIRSLPKGLRRLHFKVEGVPDIVEPVIQKDDKIFTSSDEEHKTKILTHSYYEVPNCVTQWVSKVETCNFLAHDARQRKDELVQALSNVDKKIANITHMVLFERPQNACNGYKRYRDWKRLVDERSVIKDELLVVSAILESNLQSLAANHIRKTVEGLKTRKFTMRDADNGEDKNEIQA